jgi:hypothetical protein
VLIPGRHWGSRIYHWGPEPALYHCVPGCWACIAQKASLHVDSPSSGSPSCADTPDVALLRQWTGTRVENTVTRHGGRTARTRSSDWSSRAEKVLSCVLHYIRVPVVALIQPHGNLGFHGVVERMKVFPLVRSLRRQTTTYVMCRFTMIVEEL